MRTSFSILLYHQWRHSTVCASCVHFPIPPANFDFASPVSKSSKKSTIHRHFLSQLSKIHSRFPPPVTCSLCLIDSRLLVRPRSQVLVVVTWLRKAVCSPVAFGRHGPSGMLSARVFSNVENFFPTTKAKGTSNLIWAEFVWPWVTCYNFLTSDKIRFGEGFAILFKFIAKNHLSVLNVNWVLIFDCEKVSLVCKGKEYIYRTELRIQVIKSTMKSNENCYLQERKFLIFVIWNNFFFNFLYLRHFYK